MTNLLYLEYESIFLIFSILLKEFSIYMNDRRLIKFGDKHHELQRKLVKLHSAYQSYKRSKIKPRTFLPTQLAEKRTLCTKEQENRTCPSILRYPTSHQLQRKCCFHHEEIRNYHHCLCDGTCYQCGHTKRAVCDCFITWRFTKADKMRLSF